MKKIITETKDKMNTQYSYFRKKTRKIKTYEESKHEIDVMQTICEGPKHENCSQISQQSFYESDPSVMSKSDGANLTVG